MATEDEPGACGMRPDGSMISQNPLTNGRNGRVGGLWGRRTTRRNAKGLATSRYGSVQIPSIPEGGKEVSETRLTGSEDNPSRGEEGTVRKECRVGKRAYT
ncbi:nucleoside-diphosphate kinase [Anopheles sinensis]|uniref:Nucleoside-diphosphate kinase n=1 Tax=Anopheles sinensis TaxID=74873 RepID=A0A084W616_ANOSI|nr:nucleoside-diphosphate kinase [Anopheles sinensis]